MKCDGGKPKCSSCVAYEADCQFGLPSRSSVRKRKQIIQTTDTATDLHDRVENLELQLQQLKDDSSSGYISNSSVFHHSESQPDAFGSSEHETTQIEQGFGHTANRNDLPPFDQTLAQVQVFLTEFNSCLPLFDPKTLLRLVIRTYDHRSQDCDIRAWAAIHVVLGLTLANKITSRRTNESVASHLRKAQSVFSNLLLYEVSLFGVQISLGIVMLLRTYKDPQPAQILMAATMRMVHKLGLHNRMTSANMEPTTVEERSNVFWLAYILDKDISMHSKLPSIQLDDDIDLDLPGSDNHILIDDSLTELQARRDNDSYAIVVSNRIEKTFFRTRIRLATLQGGVYDYLFSTRAQKRNVTQRMRALESVADALFEWKTTLPAEFRDVESFEKLPDHIVVFLGNLNYTIFLCTTLVYQAHAWNSGWVSSLHRYGREGVEPILPPHWEALVVEARDIAKMSHHLEVRGSRANFW